MYQYPWGLYYKTFYGSNCCHIVMSQSVCHFLSLSPQSNIWGQGSIIPKQSHILDSALKVGSQSCPQILGQSGSDRKWHTLQLVMIWQQFLLKKFYRTGPHANRIISIGIFHLELSLFVIRFWWLILCSKIWLFFNLVKPTSKNGRIPNLDLFLLQHQWLLSCCHFYDFALN